MHPQQSNCDQDNPKQFAAWCWAAGIPDPSPVRPLPIPLISPQLVEGISEMLWEFGFRHHSDLQKRWVEGTAGLGTIATLADKPPESDPILDLAEEFLSQENPQLLEAIKKAPKEKREEMIRDLEKNFAVLEQVLRRLKD